ncbi:MAG: ribonuclease J [Clostridia bacterium]|nr:ribonuclease J [Clostridia bacterium]
MAEQKKERRTHPQYRSGPRPKAKATVNRPQRIQSSGTNRLKIIPLGGMREIGKNMTLLEYGDEIMIIDCGLAFPDDEMLGIDIVIPDFTYLINNSEKIKGMIITHAHEDHIGAVPYFLKSFNIPIYGTRLTVGFIKNKLKEHNIEGNLNVVTPGDIIQMGCFSVETIHTTHSVADALCLAIDTPVGKVFHTGDFKIDYTPVDGEPINFGRLARIGDEGVLLMLADSTNAGRKGYTASEKTVGIALGNIFRGNLHRIIIATFSSNVHRVQKIMETAVENGRKIAISGRSMENMVNIATELGYLNIPASHIVNIHQTKSMKDSEFVIITTGSQGEPMSALTRMANNEHRAVQIRKGDVVILSSTPVPGNEKTVSNVVNSLLEQGADVIYNDIADTHVSGHACEEELKLIHTLIRPKYFMPVHGEFKHLRSHAMIAEAMGMSPDNIFYMENGDILEVTEDKARRSGAKVSSNLVMVDGLGVGDVGSIVLNERKSLSEAGLIVIAATFSKDNGELLSGPELISRGFVYVRENNDLMKEAQLYMEEVLMHSMDEGIKDRQALKNELRDALRNFIYKRTKRNPVILPIFLEN